MTNSITSGLYLTITAFLNTPSRRDNKATGQGFGSDFTTHAKKYRDE